MARNRYDKPSDDVLRLRLDPLSYEVTQHDATEPPFRNRYWDNHEAGIYVDIVSGEPLFSSDDKFDSGTGWPSFSAPLHKGFVVERVDATLGMVRTEVRSKTANSHLGHLFDDGPGPTGLRYCINSASLRFIPRTKLAEEGYSQYASRVGARAADAIGSRAGMATHDECATVPSGSRSGCQATLEEAYLAGGCFWGMQAILRNVPGVIQTEVGYMGGSTPSPRYEDVRTGTTGHAETVRVVFDPARLGYADLLEKWFFRLHDPTTPNQQGNDIGTQYRSVVFVASAVQRTIASEVVERAQQSERWTKPIVTQIADAGAFFRAEEDHQDYLEKHPGGYTCHYLR